MTTLEAQKIAQDDGLLSALAEAHGVCAHPILQQIVDTETGHTRTIALPCGSTHDSKCPPCAEKARQLRIRQCHEGWHLEDEPVRADAPPDSTDPAENGEERADRRVRSTRRRQDVADLPRVAMAERTVGKVIASPNGKTYRPSMFLTLTLPSYGRVRSDGTPVSPDG